MTFLQRGYPIFYFDLVKILEYRDKKVKKLNSVPFFFTPSCWNLKKSSYRLYHQYHQILTLCIHVYICIFPHSDTPYLSKFSPNAGKCEKNTDQNNSEDGNFLRIVYNDIKYSIKKHFKYNKSCIGYISSYISLVINFIAYTSNTPDYVQQVCKPSSQLADNRCINKNTLSLKQKMHCLYICYIIHCLYIKHPTGVFSIQRKQEIYQEKIRNMLKGNN